jgi:hypothetical protein
VSAHPALIQEVVVSISERSPDQPRQPIDDTSNLALHPGPFLAVLEKPKMRHSTRNCPLYFGVGVRPQSAPGCAAAATSLRPSLPASSSLTRPPSQTAHWPPPPANSCVQLVRPGDLKQRDGQRYGRSARVLLADLELAQKRVIGYRVSVLEHRPSRRLIRKYRRYHRPIDSPLRSWFARICVSDPN